jgi:hypothetical protein
MISCNVQHVYEQHIQGLSPSERLRLVELIMRGMAAPADTTRKTDGVEAPALDVPDWQPIDHRGLSDWRDRVL